MRVLVVDDNEDAANSLAALLEVHGYETRVAYNGRDGLEAAREYAPNCVISDAAMPLMDGYALARAVRSDPALAGVKMVAMSAFADDRHARQATEAGFDYQVTKGADPIKLLEVMKMIEQIKDLARQNVDLVGQTRDLLKEVKDDVREVKQEVKELKKEVKQLKQRNGESDPN